MADEIVLKGRPIGIYEGLRLENVDSNYIYGHIRKATINYNPQGVKEVFVVAYVRGKSTGFGEFWSRFMECARAYDASDIEYQIAWDEEEEETGLSAVRSLHSNIHEMLDIHKSKEPSQDKVLEKESSKAKGKSGQSL